MDSKFCVGFQRSTYKGRKPHFFIYEILRRKVVRRFLPLLDQYNKDWFSDTLSSGIGINLQYESTKKASDGRDSSGSELEGMSTEEGNGDSFVEDVSVFEVSPKGTYMVSYVSQDFIVLKMLPRGTTQSFERMLTPSFMVLEHIPMQMLDQYDDYNEDVNSIYGDSVLGDGHVKKASPADPTLFP